MARERSPNYPSSTLDEAVNKIKVVFDHVGRTKVTADDLAKALGYSGLSGASRTALAALSAYNLLSRQSRTEYVVSDIALGIIHPATENERVELMKQAALGPALFRKIYETSAGCSQPILINKLIRDFNFTTEGAATATDVYFKNKVYTEYKPASADIEAPTNTPALETKSPDVGAPESESSDDYKLSLTGPGICLSLKLDNATNVQVARMYIDMIGKTIEQERT